MALHPFTEDGAKAGNVSRSSRNAQTTCHPDQGRNHQSSFLEIDLLATQQLGVQRVDVNGSASERLNQHMLDVAQFVVAAEVAFD
jgi:hypothetical protein